MSHLLWKYYWENDVDRFRHLLAPAGHVSQNLSKSPGVGNSGAYLGGSPGAAGGSPRGAPKTRKTSGYTPSGKAKDSHAAIGRNDINTRDHAGLTILLRAASSTDPNAHAFVQALINHPAIDIHVQDFESGWNALHRSLYAGNVSIARMLLEKEREYLSSHSMSNVSKAGLLIKTKDNEGQSPFDLYNSTIAQRSLNIVSDIENSDSDSESGDDVSSRSYRTPRFSPAIRLETEGDELYVFGSNKNLSLGVGDEDDRQFPEKVHLSRPENLVQRFYKEFLEKQGNPKSGGSPNEDDIPALVRNRPLVIQDVIMSKLHSAIITTDPVLNLYICGVGRGGRLGLGDENTQFRFTPVQGPLADRKIHQVALGQNHTLAVAGNGELWAWGLNTDSQLGFVLPPPSRPDEEPMCVTPRQVFGSLKKELISGVAASAIHSVAHTGSSLFCWGRNVGQLALMDADSRSLDIQQTPRRVAASLLSAPILMVSAIDKATSCLLSNHTVWVFANYGYNQVKFPIPDAFANYNIGSSFSNHYDPRRREIHYITSSGDTIAAVTGAGDLFTMQLNFSNDAGQPAGSTTNPVKIKSALTPPRCIWDSRKDGVASVNVGEHGSVIICTESGAVWKRVKRSKGKSMNSGTASSGAKRKEFKFERVPYITNCVAARGSPFGAFAAIRQNSKVMSEQMFVDARSIWDDIGSLLPLQSFDALRFTNTDDKALKAWTAATIRGQQPESTAHRLLQSMDIETNLKRWLEMDPSIYENKDMIVWTSSAPEIKIPVHSWILAARSPTLRTALSVFRKTGHTPDSETFDLSIGDLGTELMFVDVDIYTMLNVVVCAYHDAILPVWRFTREAPAQAFRFRQVRIEVMKLATKLQLPQLETAARLQTSIERSLNVDFQQAITDPRFFEDGDVSLELDGEEVTVHSQLLCQRCPFFKGMFFGRSGGQWLSERRGFMDAKERMTVDLSHMNPEAFDYVLKFLYADVGAEIFDDVVSSSIDDFSELVLDIMGIANELMLDRLSQICQSLIGKFVTTRNIAVLLNEISPCAVTDFKNTGLEYICLQLESMLENNLLDGLDEDLMYELDEVVRANQLARFPFAKSGRSEQFLHELDLRLAEDIEEERRIRVREMAYKATQKEEDKKLSSSYKTKFGSLDELASPSPTGDKSRRRSRIGHNEPFSPTLRPQTSQADLIFDMDDEDPLNVGTSSTPLGSNARREGKDGMDEPISKLPKEWSLTKSKGLGASHASPMDSPYDSISASPQLGTSMNLGEGTAHEKAAKNHQRPPWASSALPTTKLDLRDIMTEANSGSSALSSGIAEQMTKQSYSGGPPPPPPAGSGKSQPRMSQKERKKQMQLHAESEAAEQASKSKQVPWEKVESGGSRPAPWKSNIPAPAAAAGPQKLSLPDAMRRSESLASPAVAAAARAGAKPLVASETGGAGSSRTRTASPDTRFPGQGRTSSSPAVPSASDTRSKQQQQQQQQQNRKPMVPHSKSYVTTTTPRGAAEAEALLGASMADIIAHEKRERELVREAVAKRSLQEIQQEQEFQDWWDQESRRVQGEEEARRSAKDARSKDARSKDAKTNQRGRRGRGGGGGGEGGGGRGGGGAGKQTQNNQEKAPANKQGNGPAGTTSRGGGAPTRGRGNRGRGRKAQV